MAVVAALILALGVIGIVAYLRSSSPVVSSRPVDGTVVSLVTPIRPDKRPGNQVVTVRVGDQTVSLANIPWRHLQRGDEVDLIERTHADGHRTYTWRPVGVVDAIPP
jgi:hypothetical protein